MFSLFGANLVTLARKSELLTKILEKVFSDMTNAMEAFL
jgi:hypothetical protein